MANTTIATRTIFHLRRLSRRIWVRTNSFALLAFVAAGLSRPLATLLPDALLGLGDSQTVLDILSVLSSSMLAVTTFSLGVILSARQAISSTITPRAHELVAGDPVTATLPVVPRRVHSGVPPVAGAAVGQDAAGAVVPGGASGVAGAVMSVMDDATGGVDGVLEDAVLVSLPQPARVSATAVAQAARAAGEAKVGGTVSHLTVAPPPDRPATLRSSGRRSARPIHMITPNSAANSVWVSRGASTRMLAVTAPPR